jgi:malonyl CoA-acyl carrier protein transacylase
MVQNETGKRLYAFPGQGSQHVGMGESLFQAFPKEVAIADKLVGYSVVDACLNGDNQFLSDTRNTQPLIYVVSCLDYLQRMNSAESPPDMLIGHSLGFCSAMFAGGAVDFETGLAIVISRATLMADMTQGGMVAIVGEPASEISSKLVEFDFIDFDIANYNSPEQIVVSGPRNRLTELIEAFQQQGSVAIELPVSGAFHSRYMETARIKFAQYLTTLKFKTPVLPIISCIHARVLERDYFLEELAFQLIRPVRWYQTIEHLANCNPGMSVIEMAPGTVLTRLIGKLQYLNISCEQNGRKI